MKKILSLLLALVLTFSTVAILASCGGGDDDGTYTVTFKSNGGTKIPKQTVVAGQKATKPADPEMDRYVFLGWMLNGVPYDFNTPVTSDITLEAEWSEWPVTPIDPI